MEFSPTINEENSIGGSQNFGAHVFVPVITNVTGTYVASGVYQKMGKVLFWSFQLTGTSTTATSVFTPPVSPERIHPAATYEPGDIAHNGVFFDRGAVKGGVNILGIMTEEGTCVLSDYTITDGVRRVSGFYWIK